MNNVAMIKAETALLQNGRLEAETILLQAGLPLKAIMLNLQLFQFEKWPTLFLVSCQRKDYLYTLLSNWDFFFVLFCEQLQSSRAGGQTRFQHRRGGRLPAQVPRAIRMDGDDSAIHRIRQKSNTISTISNQK